MSDDHHDPDGEVSEFLGDLVSAAYELPTALEKIAALEAEVKGLTAIVKAMTSHLSSGRVVVPDGAIARSSALSLRTWHDEAKRCRVIEVDRKKGP